MSVATEIRIGLVGVGLLVMGMTFLLHAEKKMAVNLAVVWEFLGFAAILTGVVPFFSKWCNFLDRGTALAMFGVGLLVLWGCFEFSLIISKLTLRNRELACRYPY